MSTSSRHLRQSCLHSSWASSIHRSTTPSRFASSPFKLIETPIHALKCSKPYDQYLEAASIMVLGHNVIIRGLNSIYNQAPHIGPDAAADFIEYAKSWYEVLDAHHNMEENTLFPQIEEQTGENGIMDVNIEQHHAFLPGLQAYRTYLNSCSLDPTIFSGTQLLIFVDDFAPTLVTHLSDEIPTLLSLSKFGPTLPLLSMINAESAKSPLFLSKTGGVPFFFRNLDVEFEDGLWTAWPPMPGLVWWFMQRTFVMWHSRWWRFASCDEQGRLRMLPYYDYEGQSVGKEPVSAGEIEASAEEIM